MTSNKNKVYIIAEIGVNHNGSISLAKKMILAAKKSGADAVKFQNFTANSLTTKNAKKAPYQLRNTKNSQSQYRMLKNLELELPQYFILKKFAKKNKIDFFTSIFDKESIFFLRNKLKQKVIKIPSGEINNPLIIDNLNIRHYKLIVSIGMASMKEITDSLNSILKRRLFKIKNNRVKITNISFLNKIKKRISLLHCVTDYPVQKNFANLKCIKTLAEEFKIPVGYSDHTRGVVAPVIAVSLGAQIIEKHFTLSKKMSGPDHKASLEPKEFSRMVDFIRDFEVMLGDDS